MNAIVLVIWLLTVMLSLANPEVVDLDKTGTTAISRNNFGSQLFENKHVTSRQVFQAERTGFEPVERCDPFTGLANRRIRPLCHLS